MVGVMPLVAPGDTVPIAGRLAALARGEVGYQRSLADAARAAQQQFALEQMKQQQDTLRTGLTNIDKIASVAGGQGAGLSYIDRAFPGGLSPGALAQSFGYAEQADQFRKMGDFGSAIKDIGAGFGDLRGDAGFAASSPYDMWNAIENQVTPNLTSVPTESELDLAGQGMIAKAMGVKDVMYAVVDKTGKRVSEYTESEASAKLYAQRMGLDPATHVRPFGMAKDMVDGNVPVGSVGDTAATTPAPDATVDQAQPTQPGDAATVQANAVESQRRKANYDAAITQLQANQPVQTPQGVTVIPDGAGGYQYEVGGQRYQLNTPIERFLADLYGANQ